MDYKKIINDGNNGRFEDYVAKIEGLKTASPKAEDAGDQNLNYLILINKKNSDIIEKEIEKDVGYIQFTKMIVEYHKMKNTSNPNTFPTNDKNAILAVVRMIDVENSTNVWRFNRKSLEAMVNKIIGMGKNFWRNLMSTSKGVRRELVDLLATSAKIGQSAGDEETENGPQPNSLASKVCKYFAQYIKDDNKQELYFINDSFVRQALPFYYHYYVNKDKKSYKAPKTYADLFNLLEEILNKANQKHKTENQKYVNKRDKEFNVTRGQMDHIMWYCYKNSGNTEGRSKNKKLKPIKQKDFLDYCKLFVRLYGAVPLDCVFEIINNEQYLDRESMNNYLKVLNGNCTIKRLGEKDFLCGKQYTNDDIEHLNELYDEKKYYAPKKYKSIMNKTNQLNDDNEKLQGIRKAMIDEYGEDQRDAISRSIEKYLEDLSKPNPELAKLIFNEEEISIKAIVDKAEDLKKNTRLPGYLGNTRVSCVKLCK